MDKLSKLFNSRKTKIEYTEGQKQALLKISKFLESKDNFFLLSGYSGCGKTTIAENIANFTKCTLLAPTNAAVNRLRDKIDNDNLIYKTIHSLLFSSKDDKNGFYEDKTFKKAFTKVYKKMPLCQILSSAYVQKNIQLAWGYGNTNKSVYL